MGIKFIKMEYSFFVLAALMLATTEATALLKKKEPPPTAADTPSSGYFGADDDDVMNNIFGHYAVEVTNAAGQKTGQKTLYKEGCQKACAEILPRTWAKFDSNNTGEIDITESHTFMRSLLGRLNQFVLAPGSLTDIDV